MFVYASRLHAVNSAAPSTPTKPDTWAGLHSTALHMVTNMEPISTMWIVMCCLSYSQLAGLYCAAHHCAASYTHSCYTCSRNPVEHIMPHCCTVLHSCVALAGKGATGTYSDKMVPTGEGLAVGPHVGHNANPSKSLCCHKPSRLNHGCMNPPFTHLQLGNS